MIDLNPKHFEIVQHILAKHVHGSEVRAFGSRVKWTAKDYSDLDLAVVGSKPLTLRQGRQLAEAFEESDLPIRVDVLDWHTISEEFKRIIAEEYEVIQGAEPVKTNEESVATLKNSSIKNKRWNLVKLGDVVKINPQRKLTKTKEAFHAAMRDIEVYRREISSHSYKEFRGSGTRFRNGDTLLARITPCLENGKTVYVNCLKPDQVGHGSTEFIVLSGIEGKTDNLFVYYLARNPILRAFAIHSMQGSTGRQRVMADSLRSFEFSLPPIKEQRRIAHILGTLDEKIELNRQMNETLEAMARAIFKSWFVNFDPVKAKMEGRKPPCMDTETAALFPSAFQDSSLGKIPQGWEVEKIGNLVEIVKGRSYRSSELTESDVALVSIKSIMRGGGYRPDNLRPYTGKYNPEQIITPGELVIAYTDLTQEAEILGKPAIVRGDEKYQTLVPSLHLRIIRPLKLNVSVQFLYCLFRERHFQSHIYGYATGTTVLGLSKDGVPNYQFALPPEKIRCLFDSIAKPLFAKIESNENESRTLTKIRDTLLPKLLSGEIRVDDADEILEVKDGGKP